MDAKARAKLIRQRLKNLFPVAVAPRPVAKVKRVERPKPGVMRTAFYGVGILEQDRRKKWVAEPDAKASAAPRTKRNAGVPVLTQIAAKAAPNKLVRTYRDAETLLASRARR